MRIGSVELSGSVMTVIKTAPHFNKILFNILIFLYNYLNSTIERSAKKDNDRKC